MTGNIENAIISVTKQIGAEWDAILEGVREQDAEQIRDSLDTIDLLDGIVEKLKDVR